MPARRRRVGVSHCLGVGGRDLSAEVGGRRRSRRSTCSTPTRRPNGSSSSPSRRRRRWPTGPARAPPGSDSRSTSRCSDRAGRPSPTRPSAWSAPLGGPGGARAWPAAGRRRPRRPRRPARALRRRHALRRGHARSPPPGSARCGPTSRSAAAGRCRRPARRRARDDRLRRRPAHPRSPASDDRPTLRLDRLSRRRPTRPAACCCSTSCSATAAHPDPAAELAPALAEPAYGGADGRDSPSWCRCRHGADPQGLAPAGRGAARGRRVGLPVQRATPALAPSTWWGGR